MAVGGQRQKKGGCSRGEKRQKRWLRQEWWEGENLEKKAKNKEARGEKNEKNGRRVFRGVGREESIG